MLKYFTMTVNAVIIAAIAVGLLRGYAKAAAGRLGSMITAVFCGAAFIGAGVMAYMKNATKKIDTSLWNYRIFVVSLVLLGAMLLIGILRMTVPGYQRKFQS